MDKQEITARINDEIGEHGACVLPYDIVEKMYPTLVGGMAKLTMHYSVSSALINDEPHIVLRSHPRERYNVPTIKAKA